MILRVLRRCVRRLFPRWWGDWNAAWRAAAKAGLSGSEGRTFAEAFVAGIRRTRRDVKQHRMIKGLEAGEAYYEDQLEDAQDGEGEGL